jgi:hypothetical protein
VFGFALKQLSQLSVDKTTTQAYLFRTLCVVELELEPAVTMRDVGKVLVVVEKDGYQDEGSRQLIGACSARD